MATLREELANDPEGRGYAEMSFDEILADLAERRYPADTVGVEEVTAFLDTHLLRPKLRRLMENAEAPQEARDVAETALGLSAVRYPFIAVAVAEPMVAAMQQAGVFTAEQATGLLALADNKRCRCDVLGIATPDAMQLREALGNG